MSSAMSSERLVRLRQNLVEYYNDEELRTVCFDLGVDYDDLPGRAKADKARELLAELDRQGRISDLVKICSAQRPNVSWEEIVPAAQAQPPFKGLLHFDEADADLFFGREQLTVRLIQRLRENSFLAVVGASGSGKSSVVRAGLVPALKRGAFAPDSTRWPVHVLTPTAHPLKELAASLTRDSDSVRATALLMDDLAQDPRALDLAVARQLKQTGTANRLLLVIDQFEELFTACKDEIERTAFVNNLLYAASPATQGPTIVVVVLRADFYAHCAQFANLREALAKYQEYIGPMSGDELRRAIQEPARRNGWDFEPGLVDLLLRDVGDEPGALPLLAHALLETWNRREGRTLTLAGYYEAGGVQKAIARTADAVLAEMKPEQQVIARSIFLRLTELGEGTQDTRRRAGLDELVPGAQAQSGVDAVLKVLADARLVTTDANSVEVAHEAVIREWPTLRGWLDQDRAGLRLHRQLAHDAHEWQRSNRDESTLYRGGRLVQASEWSAQHHADLAPMEREFLAKSREVAEREFVEREAQRQREMQAAQNLAREAQARARAERRMALVGSGLAALLLIMLISIFLLIQEPIRQNRLRQQAIELGQPVELPADTAPLGVKVDKAHMGEYLAPTRYALPAFAIERYEVTIKRYLLCVQAGACSHPNGLAAEYTLSDKADLPVTSVTSLQAAEFCRWLGWRLPTEFEWEYAARGSDGWPWPWGNESPSPARANFWFANLAISDTRTLSNVGSTAAGKSPVGMFDMAGNAWEWTSSAYQLGAPGWTDINVDPPSILVMRGGGANISPLDHIGYRQPATPFLVDRFTGFRCAQSR